VKVITVVGARPQFVKAAVLSRAFKNYPKLKEIIVHTGQHYDDIMSDAFFRDMDIPDPDYNLGIHSSSHAEMTAKMLVGLEEVLLKERPNMVILYGDTNSTLAGALAAAKLNIPIAHVEAGLRSFNKRMPEEINRIITDRLSHLLFAPGETAVKNLDKEGIKSPVAEVLDVGDIMYDALLYYKQKAMKPSALILPKDFILLTLHRQENLEDSKRLIEFFEFVDTVSKDINVVFPCHPGTRKKMDSYNITTKARIIEPVGYFQMLYLLEHSKLVMTDSGGLQKEAFYMNKFCITLREETEWLELVELGVNALCGLDKASISKALDQFMDKSFAATTKPYGNGNTGKLIAKAIVNHLS